MFDGQTNHVNRWKVAMGTMSYDTFLELVGNHNEAVADYIDVGDPDFFSVITLRTKLLNLFDDEMVHRITNEDAPDCSIRHNITTLEIKFNFEKLLEHIIEHLDEVVAVVTIKAL